MNPAAQPRMYFANGKTSPLFIIIIVIIIIIIVIIP